MPWCQWQQQESVVLLLLCCCSTCQLLSAGSMALVLTLFLVAKKQEELLPLGWGGGRNFLSLYIDWCLCLEMTIGMFRKPSLNHCCSFIGCLALSPFVAHDRGSFLVVVHLSTLKFCPTFCFFFLSLSNTNYRAVPFQK